MEHDRHVYENLAAHLDRLPSGFPRTESGVELRILRRLFTPQEALLAQQLSLKPETDEQIAARSGRAVAEVAEMLLEMSRKGLIFRIRKGPQTLYMAAQFVIGIWEYHVNDLDVDLIRDVNEYIPHLFRHTHQFGIPQLRTIPIPAALNPEQAIMPYEQARQLIAAQEKILVAPCICRKEHQMAGHGCDKPLETCLVFGLGAAYYEENGLGRVIDQEQALQILQWAEETGLVLQPSNSQNVLNICACCGCCCQILKNLKTLPNPVDYVASNYFAVVDEQLCAGCETCLERCQMDAIEMRDDTAFIKVERCIGCGLCVPTCPDNAIALTGKPEQERRDPPRRLQETYLRIAKERMARLQGMAQK